MAERARTWRDEVFRNRGALLAAPAVALALFGRPTAASVSAGLPLAFAGEALRCWAVGYSGKTTRADHVTAPALVTAGPYAYTRNPLYIGNFTTALGFAVAFTGTMKPAPRLLAMAAGLGLMAGVYAAIVPLEEAYLRATFGATFEDYTARVPRLGPRWTASEPQLGSYDPGVIASAESRTFLTFGAMLATLLVKAARA